MSAGLFVGWAIEALIASAVLMVIVLLLRVPVRRAFGPDIAYALWALPALRLLLPPLPGAWHEVAAAPVLRATEQVTVLFVEPVAQTGLEPAVSSPLLGPALLALWALGAVAFILWHGVSHTRFCRRMIDRAARTAEIEGGVQLIETDAAAGPLAFGIVHRYVAFPRDFAERYDAEERNLALAHELGHHARGDLIANWVALVVLALHWFNPVAWRAFRAFRIDQEIANDARVLAGQNPVLRHVYACAIVKAAHGGVVSAACHLHTIDDLKGRLRMLTTTRTPRLRLLAGVGAIALLTTTGLVLTASGTPAAAKVRTTVENATGVNLATLDVTPPAPPAPPVVSYPVAPSPAAPATAVQTPEPPLPPVIEERDELTTTKDGKKVRKRVMIFRHGDPAAAQQGDVLHDIPEVMDIACAGTGDGEPLVRNEVKNGKRIIILCNNRIEKVAADGARVAANSRFIEDRAMRSALFSLRIARRSIEGNANMTPEQRSEALKGIDQALKEVTEQIGKN